MLYHTNIYQLQREFSSLNTPDVTPAAPLQDAAVVREILHIPTDPFFLTTAAREASRNIQRQWTHVKKMLFVTARK